MSHPFLCRVRVDTKCQDRSQTQLVYRVMRAMTLPHRVSVFLIAWVVPGVEPI
jgi:hypothetical protein